MIKKICYILECSRVFSVPMSIFSWLVVFTYGLTQGGNAIFGVLALIGIVFGQLATNVFDDYCDFKDISKKADFVEVTHKTKCRYLVDGIYSLNQTLGLVIFYLAVACLMGAILLYYCGFPVVIFAACAGIFILLYSKMSTHALSEFAVFTVYGPILFGGVYWVMTQSLNPQIFIIGLSVVVFTVNLVTVNALMDYDGDSEVKKQTLCIKLGSKDNALKFLVAIWSLGYLAIILSCIFHYLSPIYLITLLTIPYAVQLHGAIDSYNKDKNSVPKKYWFNVPFENTEDLKAKNTESFVYRLYFSRNLMVYHSILMCVAILISHYL